MVSETDYTINDAQFHFPSRTNICMMNLNALECNIHKQIICLFWTGSRRVFNPTLYYIIIFIQFAFYYLSMYMSLAPFCWSNLTLDSVNSSHTIYDRIKVFKVIPVVNRSFSLSYFHAVFACYRTGIILLKVNLLPATKLKYSQTNKNSNHFCFKV